MDPEIKAMADIAEALAQLDPDAIKRVLKWATERYQVKATTHEETEHKRTDTASTFSEFQELFQAANPVTGLDKVLVAAYWFQVVKGYDELDSFELNKELKHFGHPSSNITRDLDSLINRTPRLVIQIGKEGGRRRYKLTVIGIRSVQRMLTEKQSTDESTSS